LAPNYDEGQALLVLYATFAVMEADNRVLTGQAITLSGIRQQSEEDKFV
jgi:hypothetical protein